MYNKNYQAGNERSPAAQATPDTAPPDTAALTAEAATVPPDDGCAADGIAPTPAPTDPAARIEALFAAWQRANPTPRTELHYRDAYTLLVAVVLSAQATDAGVNKATAVLFARAATPQAMVELGEDGVREAIKTIGLYRNKAKNVVALSRLLLERDGGAVPRDRAALEALPGVGRKTANVVLNEIWHEPTIAVDTHVFRVSNRLGIAPGETPLAVEEGLLAAVPARYAAYAHHWLILHGRHVCKARKPDCARCVVADLCRFEGRARS